MSGFPLLEQLRAARERAEAEITAPLRLELQASIRIVSALRREIDAWSAAITTGISDRIFDEIRHQCAQDMAPILMKALGSNDPAIIIEIPGHALRFMSPNDVQQAILERARFLIEERAEASIRACPPDRITMVRISIPSISAEVTVAYDLLRPSGRDGRRMAAQ